MRAEVKARFVCEDPTCGAASPQTRGTTSSGHAPPQTKSSNSGQVSATGAGNPSPRRGADKGARPPTCPTPYPAYDPSPSAPWPRPGTLCGSATTCAPGAQAEVLGGLREPGSQVGMSRAPGASLGSLEGAAAPSIPASKVPSASPESPALTHRARALGPARSVDDRR